MLNYSVPTTIEYLGNKELLNFPKTAFLASRHIKAEGVLQCYDWATENSLKGRCIVSGFHSKLEKDVLHFLIKGEVAIIIVLARKMYKKLPDVFINLLAEGRLLIISVSNYPRQSEESSHSRNCYICDIADEILFVSLHTQSSLYPLYLYVKDKKNVMLIPTLENHSRGY